MRTYQSDILQLKNMKDIAYFIDSLVGLSASVYPRWKKKDFEETVAKVCNVCGRQHTGGILCCLGVARMSMSSKVKLSNLIRKRPSAQIALKIAREVESSIYLVKAVRFD